MPISSREDLVEYCLRKLGSPVINIEVDEEQVNDRIDDAIEFFQEIHYEGTEKVFLKHQVTGSRAGVSNTAFFEVGEKVVGQTSGASFTIHSKNGPNLIFESSDKELVIGEVLLGEKSGGMATLVEVFYGDIHNKWITLPENILGVSRVLPFRNNYSSSNYASYVFDPQYHLVISEISNLANTSVLYYSQLESHLSLINKQLRALDTVNFNRRTGKIYLEFDWSVVKIGDFLVFDCFRAVDPESFPKVYNERLLKEYATALIKMQWGANTKKFEGVQILGGIQIQGQQIFNEAVEEVKELEQKIRSGYEMPPIGFLG